MRTLSLTAFSTITLNASGNGTIQLGPSHVSEVWYPVTTQISSGGTTTVNTLATCTIYAGPLAMGAYFVDATYNVFAAASSVISGQAIQVGMYVFAVFSGAAANASATLTVNGTRQVP